MTNFIENITTENIIDIIIGIAVIAVFNVILSPIFSYIILKIFNFKKNRKEIQESTFYTPLKVFFNITVVYGVIVFLKPTFNLTDSNMELIAKIYKIIVIITFANSLANSITKRSKIVETIKDKSSRDYNDAATRILVRLMRWGIYAIAAFLVFVEVGYDLSGLITGLGLGTVVLTLAAQNTITDIIGGALIVIDKPFRAGDFIKCLDYQGTVEDITFRSTRIRSLDDTIVNIPNSKITSETVENYSKMNRRRFLLETEISMDTAMDKINKLKNNLNSFLVNNEYVFNDTINIHFTEISTNGYKMFVQCYINIVDYMEFLDVKEEINKNIINILKNQNVSLAYDTKTIEIKK